MKYRIYRQRMHVEYKDVECESIKKALTHTNDPKEGFKITDSGYILDNFVTTDLSKERGYVIFQKRRF